MKFTTPDILRWWRKKRLPYNKALFFTGLMGLVVEAATQPFNPSADLIAGRLFFEMRAACVALLLFIVLANIAFTAGCFLDLVLNNRNSFLFREKLFLIVCGFAVIALIACIIFFLYVIPNVK